MPSLDMLTISYIAWLGIKFSTAFLWKTPFITSDVKGLTNLLCGFQNINYSVPFIFYMGWEFLLCGMRFFFIVQLWLLCTDMFTFYNSSEFLECIIEMNAIIIWRYTVVIFALFPTLIYIQMQELSWDVMRFSVHLAQKYIWKKLLEQRVEKIDKV